MHKANERGFLLKSVTLFSRAYGKKRKHLLDLVKSEVTSMIDELDVRLARFGTDKRGHLSLGFDGQDSEFVINFLVKKYGKAIRLENVKEGAILPGSFLEVGKVGFGLYVDIAALSNKSVDVLIPLHRIRNQFSIKKPLRTIANSLVFVDNLPVSVKITDVDYRENKIEGELAQSTLTRFEEWVHDDHERLLVFGANQEMIEIALRKTKHLEDIYEFEELGAFEYSLRCKRSTRASGIVAAIGPKMRDIPMHLFIPTEIEAKLNA
ncbi:DUF2110 family protein [Candidatus Thorarchaeota archaeon]|nr:MAG: DUF2110 family protein [Candidatus Thorarchaeota archaeon]